MLWRESGWSDQMVSERAGAEWSSVEAVAMSRCSAPVVEGLIMGDRAVDDLSGQILKYIPYCHYINTLSLKDGLFAHLGN